jgi:tRNA-binding protein
MRVGTILKVSNFPKARHPVYQLWIDFGELGVKKNSAKITRFYSQDELVGRQVIAVTIFPSRQVADFMSKVLVMGAVAEDEELILLQPERNLKNGLRIARSVIQ